jgi:alkylation response protein AidB-like acyl-CoA dehydrogenase
MMITMQLSTEEREIVRLVRDFVDSEVRPVVRELEHANTYPEALIEQMKQLGVFGLVVPPPYGEVQVSTACFALVTEELARGWMSLAGSMGGHSVVCALIVTYGTHAQRERYLPRLATGELRATTATEHRTTPSSGGSRATASGR